MAKQPDRSNVLITFLVEIVVGGFIAFGGFGQLLPRFLGAFDGVVQLETFKALRVFSLVYFLLPACFFVIWYWLFRGSLLYLKEKKLGEEWKVDITDRHSVKSRQDSFNKNSIVQFFSTVKSSSGNVFKSLKKNDIAILSIISLVLIYFQARPVYLFLQDEFKLENGEYNILIQHSIVALCMLYYSFAGAYSKWNLEYRLLWLAHYRINVIIYSLGLILSVGLITIVEPWIIYSPDFITGIGHAALIYGIGSLIGLYSLEFFWTGFDRKVRKINAQTITYLVIFTGVLTGFPALYWNLDQIRMPVLLIASIGLFLHFITYSFGRKKELFLTIRRAILRVGNVLIVTFLVWWGLGKLEGAYLRFNQNYFKNRLKASTLVSDSKLLPIFIYDKKLSLSLTEDVSNQVSLIKQINDYNHLYQNGTLQTKLDTLFRDNNVFESDPILYASLKNHFGVRSFFYNSYEKLYEKNAENKDRPKENLLTPGDIEKIVRDKLGNVEEVNTFYANVYQNIHRIIDSTLIPASKVLAEGLDQELITHFYHPINYYGENLDYYKEQQQQASQLSRILFQCEELTRFIQSKTVEDRVLFELLETKALEANSVAVSIREFRGASTRIDSLYKEQDRLFWVLDQISRDSLDMHDSIISRIKTKYQDSEVRDELEVAQRARQAFVIGELYDSLVLYRDYRDAITKLRGEVQNLERYKLNDYQSRYKRAQSIFLPYLTDAQRAGIYILSSTLIILLIAAYLNRHDFKVNRQKVAEEKDSGEEGEESSPIEEEKVSHERDAESSPDDQPDHQHEIAYDSPRYSIYVWSMVVLILLLPLVRKIDAQLINPEHPTWIIMMNTWAGPSLGKLSNRAQNLAEDSPLSIQLNNHRYLTPQDSITQALIDEISDLKQGQDKMNELMNKLTSY